MKNLLLLFFFVAVINSCANQTNNNKGIDSDSSSLAGGNAEAINVTGDEIMPYFLDSLLKFNSESDLRNAYGTHVIHAKEWGAEGIEEYHCSRLFPDTKNQVEFIWSDTLHFSGLNLINIQGEKSGWKTKDGIALGTTLKELEKLNKKPFSFYGFGWDYGGTTLWEDGYLASTNVRVILNFPGEMPEEFNGLMGDSEIKSNSALAQKANPVVSGIWLHKK